MAVEDHALFSREEALGGAAGRVVRRASAILFQIEAKTAHLAARERGALVPFPSDEVGRDRDLAFLAAFALGRELPAGSRPAVQDIERFAPDWADLVPADPRLRAAIAHLLGRRYRLVAGGDRAIRAALGLDEPAVRGAYERLYGEPPEAISLAPAALPPLSRLRWRLGAAVGRLNRLPPFWTAYAFTLTETVGAGILALPIALAAIGPAAGVVLLVLLGLVNVLTIAAIAETMTRTGSVRYEGAFFRRAVGEYLGPAGSIALTLGIVGICGVGLLSYHIGLSSVLSSATGVPAWFWMVALFAVSTFLVTRKTLSSTIASAIVVGGVNLLLIGTLTALSLGNLDPDNLTRGRVPGLNGEPFDRDVLELIFGVVLLAYFGHLSAGNAAGVVLRRDPSGRSLLWGVAAAQLSVMVVYSLWVVAVAGAVAPEALVGHAGTALEPLADVTGPLVALPGSLFVILGMGMGAVHLSMGLANAARDWLPRRLPPVVALARGRTRLSLRPRRGEAADRRLDVTYLGLDAGGPRLRFRTPAGAAVHVVRPANGSAAGAGVAWDAAPVLAALPGGDGLSGLDLHLEILSAAEELLELRVTASWPVALAGAWDAPGVDLLAVLDGDDAAAVERRGRGDDALLRWLLRRGTASLADVAAWTGGDEIVARARLTALVAAGTAVATDGPAGPTYRARLARRRRRELTGDLDRALAAVAAGDGPAADRAAGSPPSRAPTPRRARLDEIGRWLGEERSRAMIAVAPAAAIFLFAEWLVLRGEASYTAVLSFGGVICATLCAGVFPVLMLAAARRKGDLLPTVVYRALGHPYLLGAIYALFLAAIVLHGLVVWQAPALRAGALTVAGAVVVLTVAVVRRGAFAPRAVIAIRHDPARGELAAFSVLNGGRPAPAGVDLEQATEGRSLAAAVGTLPAAGRARFRLPATPARDLKVIAQRIGEAGTEGLPVVVRVDAGDGVIQRLDPRPGGGQLLTPLRGLPSIVEFLPADEHDEEGGDHPRRPARG